MSGGDDRPLGHQFGRAAAARVDDEDGIILANTDACGFGGLGEPDRIAPRMEMAGLRIVDAAMIERAGDVPAHVRLRDDFASIAETAFQKLGLATHCAEILRRPCRLQMSGDRKSTRLHSSQYNASRLPPYA